MMVLYVYMKSLSAIRSEVTGCVGFSLRSSGENDDKWGKMRPASS